MRSRVTAHFGHRKADAHGPQWVVTRLWVGPLGDGLPIITFSAIYTPECLIHPDTHGLHTFSRGRLNEFSLRYSDVGMSNLATLIPFKPKREPRREASRRTQSHHGQISLRACGSFRCKRAGSDSKGIRGKAGSDGFLRSLDRKIPTRWLRRATGSNRASNLAGEG